MVARPLKGGGIFIDKIADNPQNLSHAHSSAQLASIYNMASDLNNVRLKSSSSLHFHHTSDKLSPSTDVNLVNSKVEHLAENRSEMKRQESEPEPISTVENMKPESKQDQGPSLVTIDNSDRSLIELNSKRGGGGLKSPLKAHVKSPKSHLFQSSVVESFQRQASTTLSSISQGDDEKVKIDEVLK